MKCRCGSQNLKAETEMLEFALKVSLTCIDCGAVFECCLEAQDFIDLEGEIYGSK